MTAARDLGTLAVVACPSGWQELLGVGSSSPLEAMLPALISPRRWFAGKDRQVREARIAEHLPLVHDGSALELLVVSVEDEDGKIDQYLLPLAHLAGDIEKVLGPRDAEALLARTIGPREAAGVLVDAHYLDAYGRLLLEIAAGSPMRSSSGAATGPASGTAISGGTTGPGAEMIRSVLGDSATRFEVSRAEQSNTSIVVGEPGGTRIVLKAYRRLQPGSNPEVEIGTHLAGTAAPAAELLAWLVLEMKDSDPVTMGVVHRYVENGGDAWTTTLALVASYLDRFSEGRGPGLSDRKSRAVTSMEVAPSLVDAARSPRCSPELSSPLAEVRAQASLLGRRTAELHLALASSRPGDEFAPEPVTAISQALIAESMRESALRSLALLEGEIGGLPGPDRQLAVGVLNSRELIVSTVSQVAEVRSGFLCRIHGDLHLGQVLFTGKEQGSKGAETAETAGMDRGDFVFVDFEGEPARTPAERRLKRSPLADIAGILRSYHYAAHTGVAALEIQGRLAPALDIGSCRDAADAFAYWAGVELLAGYLAQAETARLVPATDAEIAASLAAHLMDKALYELRYELANRPSWAWLAMLGVAFVLETTGGRRR